MLAGGATVGRDLPAPGRELAGIHLAMEYLPYGNLQALGELDDPPINAAGKHVVIIGGGDTGADCLGTAHRQGAASVTQLEIMPAPPDRREQASNPWPTYPMIMRVSSAHEEGGERLYSVNTERFLGDDDGNVRALLLHEVERVDGRFQKVEGTERELPADLVFLAMGFTGAQREGLLETLGVEMDQRDNVVRDTEFMSTVPASSWPGTSAAGSRSSSGRSPRAGPRRAPPTPGSPAPRCCPSGRAHGGRAALEVTGGLSAVLRVPGCGRRGDRRGPGRGGCAGRLPHRRIGAAPAGRADRRRTALEVTGRPGARYLRVPGPPH